MKKYFFAAAFLFFSVQAWATPEDTLIQKLEAANAYYETVKDYQGLFVKQEKSKGALGPEEEIFLKFEKPFKIYMGWLNTDKKGLQVVYARGQNDGKLAIHKPGLVLGLLPVVFLDQNSPFVREGSESYNIEDAGIGTFLRDFTIMVSDAVRTKRLEVQEADGALDVTFPGTQKDKIYFAYRIRVTFDPQNNLPVKMDLYDWENKPTGLYSYENLKYNVGLDDAEFKKHINYHLLKVYRRGAPKPAAPRASSNFASKSR